MVRWGAGARVGRGRAQHRHGRDLRAVLRLGGRRQGRRAVASSGRGHHGPAGRRPCDPQHADRLRQVAGGAWHALRRACAPGGAPITPRRSRRWSREKFFDLVEVFGRDNVGMITGDTHINADAPIICCTAEILANQALREGRRRRRRLRGHGRVPLLRRLGARLGVAGAAAHAAGHAVPADERHTRRRRRDRRQAGGHDRH